MTGESDIAGFYRNRSIFITGATGFMGKVLVEKLLRCCPGIKNVYILMRPKRDNDVRTRLEELINTTVSVAFYVSWMGGQHSIRLLKFESKITKFRMLMNDSLGNTVGNHLCNTQSGRIAHFPIPGVNLGAPCVPNSPTTLGTVNPTTTRSLQQIYRSSALRTRYRV